MIELIVAAVLCQTLYEQIQCQDAGRGGTFSSGACGQQVQRQADQGRAGAWAGEAGTAVPQYHCDKVTLIRRPAPIHGQEREERMAAPVHGQQHTGCQKTWGKGVKRTEIIRMDGSTPGPALWQGSPAWRTNGCFVRLCPSHTHRLIWTT